MYPFEEQINMILIYRECQKNSLQMKNLYAERYSNRTQPSHRTYKNVCNKFKQVLNTCKSKCKKQITHEENEIGIFAIVVRNPHIVCDKLKENWY